MVICHACRDERGIYQWVNDKFLCKACTAAYSCSSCNLELYTVLQCHAMQSGLKKMFDSDADINENAVQAFSEMKQYTKLHGHSNLSYKPVTNFFQLSKGNPLSTKGKAKPYCKACIEGKAIKLAKKIKKQAVPGRNEECKVNFGTSVIQSTIVMDNILSFLSFPLEMPTLLAVHKSWKHYLTKCTDLSFVQHLYITSRRSYPTISSVPDPELLKKNQATSLERSWTDSTFLSMLKSFSKCINFQGFPKLKSIEFDPVLGEQSVTDVSFLTLLELVDGKEFSSLSLMDCPNITWVTMKKFFDTSSKPTKIRLHGIEQCMILNNILNDATMFPKVRCLEHVHYYKAGKQPMTLLAPYFKVPKLKHFGVVDSVLYWPKNRDSLVIAPFEEVKTLDFTESSMPLRNSLVEILEYFPNVEDLSVQYVQRKSFLANIKMFNRVGDRFIEDILGALEYRLFSDGELVVRKGEPGREMFFVNRGEVEVIGDVGERLATLGKGEFFGELALLEDLKRTASIRALGTCELFSLDKASFFRVMRMHPESNRIIREEANARLRQLQQSGSNSSPKKKKKQEEKKVEEDVVKGDRVSLMNAIFNLYPQLKSLRLNAKDLDINLPEFFSKLPLLEHLILALETSKESNLNSRPIEFGSTPLHLKGLRLKLERSLFSCPPEAWLGLGKVAPMLEFLHMDLPQSADCVENICSSFSNLKVLDVINSPKAAKAILRALRTLEHLRELRSDAVFFPEQVITSLKKMKHSASLGILDIPDSTWNDSQVVKACQVCPALEYLCVRTATMIPINLKQLKKNVATSHLNVVLSVKKTKRNMLRTLTKAKLALRSVKKKRSSSNLHSAAESSTTEDKVSARSRSKSKSKQRPSLRPSASVMDMRKSKSYALSLHELSPGGSTSTSGRGKSGARSGRSVTSNASTTSASNTPRLLSPSPRADKNRHVRQIREEYDAYKSKVQKEKEELMHEAEMAQNAAFLFKKEIKMLKSQLEQARNSSPAGSSQDPSSDEPEKSDASMSAVLEDNSKLKKEQLEWNNERKELRDEIQSLKEEIAALKNPGPQISVEEASPAVKPKIGEVDLQSQLQQLQLENAMLKKSLSEATSKPKVFGGLHHDNMEGKSPMSLGSAMSGAPTQEIFSPSDIIRSPKSPKSPKRSSTTSNSDQKVDQLEKQVEGFTQKEQNWQEEKKQLVKRLRKLSLLVKHQSENSGMTSAGDDAAEFSGGSGGASSMAVTSPSRTGSLAGRAKIKPHPSSTLKPIKKGRDGSMASPTPGNQPLNVSLEDRLFFEKLKKHSAGKRSKSTKLNFSSGKKYLFRNDTRASPYQTEPVADLGHPNYFAKLLTPLSSPVKRRKRGKSVKS